MTAPTSNAPKRSLNVIDLDTSSDEEEYTGHRSPSLQRPDKRIRLSGERQATPEPTANRPIEITASRTLPTPDPTPQKTSGIYSIPEIADRFVPKRDLAEGIEFTNPERFRFRPAHYHEWGAGQYARLAEDVRTQYDAISFAIENGIPLDEVKHVFSFVIVNPLYWLKEASARHYAGMRKAIEAKEAFGTPVRAWGKPVKTKVKLETEGKEIERELFRQIRGELSRVGVGCVELILDDRSKKALGVGDLVQADEKYLQATLTASDIEKLWTAAPKTDE